MSVFFLPVVELKNPYGVTAFMLKSDLKRFPDFESMVVCERVFYGVTSVCFPTVFTWDRFISVNPLAYEKEGDKLEFG